MLPLPCGAHLAYDQCCDASRSFIYNPDGKCLTHTHTCRNTVRTHAFLYIFNCIKSVVKHARTVLELEPRLLTHKQNGVLLPPAHFTLLLCNQLTGRDVKHSPGLRRACESQPAGHTSARAYKCTTVRCPPASSTCKEFGGGCCWMCGCECCRKRRQRRGLDRFGGAGGGAFTRYLYNPATAVATAAAAAVAWVMHVPSISAPG